jgi:hypothetical protein
MRYVIALSAAVIVSCAELWAQQRRHPFGDLYQKALGWWLAICAVDAGIAAMAMASASVAGGGSAGEVAGWVAIGVLAPMGLRNPVWKSKTSEGFEEVNGLVPFYTKGRARLVSPLETRMSSLRIQGRRRRVNAIELQDWTSIAALVRLEADVIELTWERPIKNRILQDAYLAMAHDEEREQLDGIVKVIETWKLRGLLDTLRTRAPGRGDLEDDACNTALQRARRYIERQRQAEALRFDQTTETDELLGPSE